MTDPADKHSAPERMYVAIHEKCDNSAAYQNIPVGSEIDASRGQSYSWLKYTRTDVAQAEAAAAVERAVLAERARCAEIADNRMDACEAEERRDQDGIGRSCYLEAQLIYERIMAPPDVDYT